ncbi:hypothetical protein [Brachybacterium paraconglomeratum]|uniref:hypothetical protein n=1 Tax=Brachybacterium paraconglomeratum TaxID=173362 RepID=UPI003F7B5AD5
MPVLTRTPITLQLVDGDLEGRICSDRARQLLSLEWPDGILEVLNLELNVYRHVAAPG